MRIAANIEMLEITGDKGTLYPTLIWDENDVILVDTGLPGQIDLLSAAIDSAGFSLSQITKVILTHQDMDHVGCAKVLSQGGAQILAHEDESAYIQGDKTPVKLFEMEQQLDTLSDGERTFYDRVKAGAAHFVVHVDRLLKDGEVLPFCGGIEVIHTPGHTPGHIALFLGASKALIAGDAANLKDGTLVGANPQHTHDIPQADRSFEKLKRFHADKIVCYHGGLYSAENS